MTKFGGVTHVIFDMDGLLLDTESLYTEAFQRMLDPHGIKYTWELKLQLMGKTGNEVAERIVQEYNLPYTTEEYMKTVALIYEELFPHAQLLPGAERLVKHLHTNHVPIAVATSSSRSSFELKTQNHKELFSLFNHIVSATSDPEVKRGKPAPDTFIVCASRFSEKPMPKQCLVFEDAPNGVEGAVSAGMQVVMVPDPHIPEEMQKKATLVISSLLDFKPQDFGLPPFSD